jgi:hypothetical protein
LVSVESGESVIFAYGEYDNGDNPEIAGGGPEPVFIGTDVFFGWHKIIVIYYIVDYSIIRKKFQLIKNSARSGVFLIAIIISVLKNASDRRPLE